MRPAIRHSKKGKEMAEKFVSPNEMMEAAKKEMLNGNEPTNDTEWARIVNFVAFNVPSELSVSICLLMKTLYDIPLEKSDIEAIALYQNQSKADAK